MSYIAVSNDDVLNSTNNKTELPELKRVFEETFDIKVQERSTLISKFTSLLLVFGVDKTDHITELVNEWFQDLKFRRVDAPFSTYSIY